MQTAALEGGFRDAPVEAAHAFRAAMTAMARPGRIVTLGAARPPAPLSPAAGTLLLTLCDASTGLWLAPGHETPAIRGWIAFHTGAPLVAPSEADVAVGAWEALKPLDRFRIGTPEYPDRSATLIVEMPGLTNTGATLSGPGIRETAVLSLPETAAFAANARAFPLGLDFFFTCGTSAAALPRSTKVTG